jgi:Tol biopolymer transport system component
VKRHSKIRYDTKILLTTGATGSRRSMGVAILVVMSIVAALPQARAFQTFPGSNGKILMRVEPRRGPEALVLMNPDGSAQMKVADGNAQYPTFSPDGRWVAYQLRAPNAGGTHLHVMRADGTADADLGFDVVDNASWSPDGRLVAASNRDVIVFNRDGTNKTVIYSAPSGLYPTSVAWSPDGSRIAYEVVDDDDLSQLFVNNPAGTQQEAIGGDICCSQGDPTWSPNGSELLFTAGPGAFVHRFDGTDDRQVFEFRDDTYYSNFAWAPDGHAIAFEYRAHHELESNVGLVDPVSGRVDDLNVGSPNAAPEYTASTSEVPLWSPDSNKITYRYGDEQYLLDVETGSRHFISSNLSWDSAYAESWQPCSSSDCAVNIPPVNAHRHRRKLTLEIYRSKNHLVALTGLELKDRFQPCQNSVRVVLQRRVDGHWLVVDESLGAPSAPFIAEPPGGGRQTYRAKAGRESVGFRAEDICGATTSNVVTFQA